MPWLLWRQLEQKNNLNVSTNKIAKKTHTKDKLYQTFKLTKLHVDQDNCRQAQNTVQNLIRIKRKIHFLKKK